MGGTRSTHAGWKNANIISVEKPEGKSYRAGNFVIS
jgi:hypothetical protein